MDATEPFFEDPALKAAICRAWAGERASAQLNRKVEAIFAADWKDRAVGASPVLPAINLKDFRFRNPFAGLAAAAVMLLSLGLIVYFASQNAAPASLPPQTAAALVLRHDGCCRVADHHLVQGVVPNDIAAVGAKMERDLNIRVLAADPGGDWKFVGAGECHVGGIRSGHLLFRRGSQTLSVFSLPGSMYKVEESVQQYAGHVDGHSIAGFATTAGVLYCLVGFSADNKLTQENIESLRDHLESGFLSNTPTGEPPTAAPAVAIDRDEDRFVHLAMAIRRESAR